MQNKNSKKFSFLTLILIFVVAIQGYFIYDLKSQSQTNDSAVSSVELLANEDLPKDEEQKQQDIKKDSVKEDKTKKEEDLKTKQIVKQKTNTNTTVNNTTQFVHDPFYEIRKMQEQMMKEFAAFNSMFANDPFFQNSFKDMSFSPLSDLKEKKDKYIVTIEIPGVEEKNIKIENKDNILFISATTQKSSDKKDENFIQKERYVQSFKRVFTLPDDANMDKLKNEYNNGILTITIPKK